MLKEKKMLFNPDDISRLRELVDGASRVVITCHVSPDGDAIGSTLALWHVLKAMGKRPAVFTPDCPPRTLMFLPGAREIMPVTRHGEKARVHLRAADLVVCLDFNALKRVDAFEPSLRACSAPVVLIDHHLYPEDFATLAISRPDASSTCYLLYEIMKAAGWQRYITRQCAECIYTGMMTDTGNFSYNSNDPGLYTDIAELIGLGIDKDSIYRNACNTHTLPQLRLNAYALLEKMTIIPEHKAAMIVLSADDLKGYGYTRGDTEGLVNVPLSLPEVTYSAFIRQDAPEYVKLSLRSKGSFPVNKICEDHFNGGGHMNAAGGEYYHTLDDTVNRFMSVLNQYDKYLQ